MGYSDKDNDDDNDDDVWSTNLTKGTLIAFQEDRTRRPRKGWVHTGNDPRGRCRVGSIGRSPEGGKIYL